MHEWVGEHGPEVVLVPYNDRIPGSSWERATYAPPPPPDIVWAAIVGDSRSGRWGGHRLYDDKGAPVNAIFSGLRRFVWWDHALWWRTYHVGGFDGYRTLSGKRLPCATLATALERPEMAAEIRALSKR